MAILVLTEKSSQVTALGKFIPLTRDGRSSRGNYKGEDVVVFPFSGHILGIVPLTSRTDDIASLPHLPPEQQFMKRKILEINEYDNDISKKSKEDNKKVYLAFKKLIETIKIDRIILATDPDYEGCAIGVEMLMEFNLMDNRINFMNISNIIPKKLQEEFDKALGGKDALDWRSWANVSLVRAEINHCSGIDISHYMMTLTKALTTFGSQQTRGLRLLVERYLAHKNFSLAKHYRIKAVTPIGDFFAELDKDRLTELSYVKGIYDSLGATNTFIVKKIEIGKKFKKSPSWYDGSDIASEISVKLKKSIKELTSKNGGLLQLMYEQGKMTYPRGDAKGKMPLSQFEEQGIIAQSLSKHYNASRLDISIKKGYLWREDGGVDSSGEIVNHTPCTIATSEIDMGTLTADERAVIDMSAKMLLSCFYPESKVINYAVLAEAFGIPFLHNSYTDDDLGWQELYAKEKKISPIPTDLVSGDKVQVLEFKFEEYTKEPPPLFTEASFSKEMKKRKIGAESTFTTHVSNILDPRRGYAEKIGGKLIPTEKGIKFIELVPNSVMDILALFEEEVFKDLVSGKMGIEDALVGRYKIIKHAFFTMKEAIDSNPELLEAIKGSSSNQRKTIVVGACPVCGTDVVDFGGDSRAYSCSGAKNQKTADGKWENIGCKFQVWKTKDNKGLKYSIGVKSIESLLKGEETTVKIYWKDSNKTIDSIIRLDMDATEIADTFVNMPEKS